MDEKFKDNHQLNNKDNKKGNKLINSNEMFSKTEMAFFDVVEQKDLELKSLKNNTKNIKKETIKEFVYSNKKIPNLWKNRRNFRNVVLESFYEDNNFLRYVGSGVQNEIIPSKTNDQKRPKTIEKEKNFLRINSEVNNNLEKKLITKDNVKPLKILETNESYSSLASSKQKKKPKIKLRKIISQKEEMENIFNDLNFKFPLKNKLQELYPNYNYEEKKDDIKMYLKRNSKTLDRINTVDQCKLQKHKKIEKNIFNNLHTLKGKKISVKSKEFSEENPEFKKCKVKLKVNNKNEIIKNELNDSLIYKHLKSMNFYGPYFSYCPYCRKNNVKYYKYMERKQCISLLNHIKLDRNKKLEIEKSKYKEKIKIGNTNKLLIE